jgi:hypothetical protein
MRSRFLGGEDRMVCVWRMWSWSALFDKLGKWILVLVTVLESGYYCFAGYSMFH